MATEKLTIEISARNRASRALRGLQTRVESLGKSLQQTGKRMTLSLTAPIVGLGAAAIKMASDAEEAANKFDVVMGASASRVRERLVRLTQTIPMTTAEMETMAAGIQDLLVPLGLARGEAADMSADMVELAGDLASFNNVAAEVPLEAIKSALAGMSRPLRQFGVDVSQSRLETLALEEGLIQAGQEMDNAARAQAVMIAVQRDSTDAMGDAARTAGSTANMMRFLRRDVKQLGIEMGQTLMPVARDLLGRISGLLERLRDMSPEARETTIKIAGLAAAMGPVLLLSGSLIRSVGLLSGAMANLIRLEISSTIASWAGAFSSLLLEVRSVTGAMALLQASMSPFMALLGGAAAGAGLIFLVGRLTGQWDDLSDAVGTSRERLGDAAKTVAREVNRDLEALSIILERIAEALAKINDLIPQIDFSEMTRDEFGQFFFQVSGLGGLIEAREVWEAIRDRIIESDRAAESANRTFDLFGNTVNTFDPGLFFGGSGGGGGGGGGGSGATPERVEGFLTRMGVPTVDELVEGLIRRFNLVAEQVDIDRTGLTSGGFGGFGDFQAEGAAAERFGAFSGEITGEEDFSAFREFGGEAGDQATDELTSTMEEGGRFAIRSLVDGLLRGVDDAEEFIKNIGIQLASLLLTQGLFSALGIASPSSEGRWAGRQLGLGLVLGMQDMMRPVANMAAGLGRAAIPDVTGPQMRALGATAAGGPVNALGGFDPSELQPLSRWAVANDPAFQDLLSASDQIGRQTGRVRE